MCKPDEVKSYCAKVIPISHQADKIYKLTIILLVAQCYGPQTHT